MIPVDQVDSPNEIGPRKRPHLFCDCTIPPRLTPRAGATVNSFVISVLFMLTSRARGRDSLVAANFAATSRLPSNPDSIISVSIDYSQTQGHDTPERRNLARTRRRSARRYCTDIARHASRQRKTLADQGFSCGRYWDRTSDLFRVREARYRCANRPFSGNCFIRMEVDTGFEPVYTALQAAASPLGQPTALGSQPKRTDLSADSIRADDEIRTRDPHLGKVMRYHCATSAMPAFLRARRLYPKPLLIFKPNGCGVLSVGRCATKRPTALES